MPHISPDTAPSPVTDLETCRKLLANGSRSFFAASFLLPVRVREPAIGLYAFCRVADDAVDRGTATEEVLDALRSRLDAAYAGTPLPNPVDRQFARVVAAHAIPRRLPEALIEGFEWDAKSRRYETFEDLAGYAARVAGSVGAMMALLMGVRQPHLLARASDLGIAMQLTNIARDVGEDARAGRLYLPQSWLREEGLDPDAWLAAPTHSPAMGRIIARLLMFADELYRRGDAGIAGLPLDCRPGIYAARSLYAEIGREVERIGLDSVSRRAVVPARRKLKTIANALMLVPVSMARTAKDQSEALHSARFLVDACRTEAGAVTGSLDAPPWWDFDARLKRVLDAFERLERSERIEFQNTLRRPERHDPATAVAAAPG